MSKAGGTTRSVAETAPPSFQSPYINKGLGEAQRLYDTGGPQYYSGSVVSPLNPWEQSSREITDANATGSMAQLAGKALENYDFGTKGVLDVGRNPFLADAAEAMVRPVMQQLTEGVLPNIRNEFANAGTYGSTKQSLAEAQASERATRAALDATSQLYANAYGQGLNTFSNTMGQMPAVMQGIQAPAQAISQIGQQERSLEQARLQEQAAREMYQNNLPFQNLVEYMNTISRPYGGTSTSQTIAPQTGTAEQLLGGGLTLLPLIGQLYSIIRGA